MAPCSTPRLPSRTGAGREWDPRTSTSQAGWETGSNRAREGSAIATAGAIRVGNTVSAALGGHRVLRAAEAGLLFGGGFGLLALATVVLLLPWILVVPVAIAAAWLGVTLIINGVKLRQTRARQKTVNRPRIRKSSSAPLMLAASRWR